MVALLSTTKLRSLSTKILFLVLVSVLILSVSASNNREEAVSSVSEAEQSLTQAYKAVRDAEIVGANISGLLTRLNHAAGMLSEAKMAFDVGNFEEAVHLAETSNEVGRLVESETESLKGEAVYTSLAKLQVFIGGSVLAVSFVLFASLLCYRYFKRRYYRRLLEMKPKVGKV